MGLEISHISANTNANVKMQQELMLELSLDLAILTIKIVLYASNSILSVISATSCNS
jgi:hypothetical protein